MSDSEKYITPTQLAKRYGIGVHKVHTWIANGELAAIDVSLKQGVGRARWRISPEAIASFELRRTALPPPPRQRRRRAQVVHQYV